MGTVARRRSRYDAVSATLDRARLYLVSPLRMRAGDLAELVPELAAAGVDLIQLREKEMEAGDVMRAADPVLAACRSSQIPFIVNDRPDVALALGADGVHVGQNDLPVRWARRIHPEGLIGLSTHAREEIDAAVELGGLLDYIAVGPVNATPTKPGRPGTGIDLVRHAATAIARVPWFVTGGMNPETLPEVLEAGGRRVVVVRALTESPDPVAAAATLKEMLLAASG
jgi:thiamine-phosphate pyrophosphorylase